MSNADNDNKSIEKEFRVISKKLESIHNTLKIGMACIIILLILIAVILLYSPTF